MIVCEYLFMEFYSHGDDDYLCAWATQVDEMGEQGWEVFDCVRKPDTYGLWTVLLCRPGEEKRSEMNQGLTED
jgi:hypothetical protein